MNYEEAVKAIMADDRYKKNIEYGIPRPGHPEGKVKLHIADLEANLELLKPRLQSKEDYWKLKFLIHVHDTFKVEAIEEGSLCTDIRSHESLARTFASEFTNDADLLNIVQYHDANYFLWKQFKSLGSYDIQWFETFLNIIKDWDLYLIFTIIDGCTNGKDVNKVSWFINQVKQHKQTRVDKSWMPS